MSVLQKAVTKRIPMQPRCTCCGGRCAPIADYPLGDGLILVRRQCKTCGSVMTQRQKIEPITKICTVQKISTETAIRKQVRKKPK